MTLYTHPNQDVAEAVDLMAEVRRSMMLTLVAKVDAELNDALHDLGVDDPVSQVHRLESRSYQGLPYKDLCLDGAPVVRMWPVEFIAEGGKLRAEIKTMRLVPAQ